MPDVVIFLGMAKPVRDKIIAHRDQARAAATSAVEKVNQHVKSAGDNAARDRSALKAKIADDMGALKARVAEREQKLDAKLAENRAERLEWDADLAIDYAIASVEDARLAVFDAMVGRVEAEGAKRA